ncbi:MULTISPECIES: FAD-dependent monooxygenase [Ramlibacter]|uniref:NAD(P)-binding protein n=1 Tax=Ramlibacter pinisoli TaxID=2682844 RepID=A0A6N8IND2_9BURK|nr:FAD-dependent monooxygenase [Ramlibacter sp. CGMCC 1.13660]MVQ27830.1 NAD(P)-binding protein [Ramlibacter pinisoli]
MKRRVVCVVGGGLAGLACALAAAQAGAAVRLLEARPDPVAPEVHVDVVPSMLRDLARLGVADACVRAGFAYRRISAIGQRGLPLYSLDAPRLAGARYPAALGIAHSDLQEILAAAARDAGVHIRYGAQVLRVVDISDEALVDVEGEPALSADFVVVACGGRDPLRERVFQAAPSGAASAAWLYLFTRRSPGFDEALSAVTAAGDKAYAVPVSGSRVGVRLASRGAQAPADAAGARALLARFPGVMGDLAHHVAPETEVVRRPLALGLMVSPWARGRIVGVGECVRALPPHFGQAAAQAIEDAVVLGELLAGLREPRELAPAFLKRREPRVRQIAAIALQAARWDEMPGTETDLLALSRALDQIVHSPA